MRPRRGWQAHATSPPEVGAALQGLLQHRFFYEGQKAGCPRREEGEQSQNLRRPCCSETSLQERSR